MSKKCWGVGEQSGKTIEDFAQAARQRKEAEAAAKRHQELSKALDGGQDSVPGVAPTECSQADDFTHLDILPSRCVILESPFAGDIETNVKYAKACMQELLIQGDAPIASHLLWTQEGMLDDNVPKQRTLGIEAGLAWYTYADAVIFFVDRGWSRGMKAALERATEMGLKIEIRYIQDRKWKQR